MRTPVILTAAAALLAAGIAVGTSGCSAPSSAAQGAGSVTAQAANFSRPAPRPLPTVVLVHGAFADSSSWDAEVAALGRAGYPVIAYADPLRGVASDSEALDGLIKTISGPVVLVGHSYAGMVISQVAAEEPSVKALVYVAAFIPQVGESVNSLNSIYPGSELVSQNLHTAAAPGGLTDVYINQDKYAQVYAGGLSRTDAAIAAATERPITAQALAEAATAAAPASTPKWEVVATKDNAVPTKLQFFMAARAHAQVVTANSGHDVPAIQPNIVTSVIERAASVATR